MTDEKISRRGVYYDLEISPYEYKSPYGDSFKFRSQKKLDVYTRDVIKEIARVEKVLERNKLRKFLPSEIVTLIYKNVYRSFYKKIEG